MIEDEEQTLIKDEERSLGTNEKRGMRERTKERMIRVRDSKQKVWDISAIF